MKNIAILTSGGDAPGMNAAIRGVVRYANYFGMTVYGIEQGFKGLLENNFRLLQNRDVSNILQRGGTILRSARCPEFLDKAVQEKAAEILKKKGIEGLVVLGGDGSFMAAKALCAFGVKSIGIPGTIDNDIAYTDFTLGFDTACNTVLDAINKLRDTMESHDRVVIVEVMGRNCGDIALTTGICGGAEVIMIPEVAQTIEEVSEKLLENKKHGKLNGIVVLSEGAGKASEIAQKLTKNTCISVRSTVLGHMQRGGAPSVRDRFLGTTMGVMAVKLLKKGIGNRIIGIKKGELFDMDIIEGLKLVKQIDLDLVEMAGIIAR